MAYKKPENVPGLIRNQDGLFLESLAEDVDGGNCIIEIGPFTGKSTCFMARGLREAGNTGSMIYSIDPWDKLDLPISGTGRNIAATRAQAHELFTDNVKKCGVTDYVTEFHGFSADAAARWNDPAPIAMVYVDGNHKYEAVREDITLWAPKLVMCGYMVFDDYSSPQVKRAVDELVQGSRTKDGLEHGNFIFSGEQQHTDRFAVVEKVG